MTTLTPELLADLRKKADAARLTGQHHVSSSDVADLYDALPPSVILALLDRIKELEAKWETPSQWRCDGCGYVERTDDDRRPDRHDGCGGMWIRQERTDA